MIDNTIHTFWLEGELSNVNYLMIRSFQDFGYKVVIHTFNDKLTTECELRDASEIYPKKDWKYYTGLHYNMRLGLIGDTLRARLLYKYGGTHCDLDVQCLNPMDIEESYIFRKHNRGVVMNYVKCPVESKFAQYYIDYTNSIDVNKNDWENSFAGLINGVRELDLEKYIRSPEELGMDDHQWFKPLLEENTQPKSKYIIHWSGSTSFYKEYKQGSYFEQALKKYNII